MMKPVQNDVLEEEKISAFHIEGKKKKNTNTANK